jgi:hypothetical protein
MCVSVIFGVTIVHVFSKYGFKTIYVFCQQKSQHINAPKHIAEQNFNQTSLKQIADTIGSKAIDWTKACNVLCSAQDALKTKSHSYP